MTLNKRNYPKTFLLITIFLSLAQIAEIHAQEQQQLDLSGNNWKIVTDEKASWQDDLLFLPGTALSKIPKNQPSGGWEWLEAVKGFTSKLPATVEQYYWGSNGNPFGVSGNYVGVSWFTTRFDVPSGMKGKKLTLHFQSARLRAEVYVNRKLVAYDLISGTPFDADISDVVNINGQNELAVRITDPSGNFDWRDSQNFFWGKYRIQPSHGFGGITGKVSLVATDQLYFDDIFVLNKPEISQVDVQLSINNSTKKKQAGLLQLQVEEISTGKIVWTRDINDSVGAGISLKNYTVKVPSAKLWSPEHPALYIFKASWKSRDLQDEMVRRFGFRWFEVRDNAGDRQFFLNGKRIVIRTAISWGFWPVNGIAPTDEMARKQILDAKALGLNMLNFHRGIGQQNVLDLADELGLLYFEEPGGNQFPENLYHAKGEEEIRIADFYFGARDEKFFRMIKRDRNHPSLVIYNMHNERGASPQERDKEQMSRGHQLDPSRIMTYNSSNGSIKLNEPDPRFKLHLMPYDEKFYDYGWFDQHHAGGPGTYHNNLYQGQGRYAKYTDHKDEIYYLGEEGAIGTPPRLQLIRDEILKTGTNIGWESSGYLKWYDAYDKFLTEKDFRSAFPNVDSLTRKMGNVAYYYQGRIIENIRLNNIIDGYAVNGWESMKLENHSGVVDNYRNLKGDAELISRYNQPLSLAVKIDKKVLGIGDTAKIDIYIINEKNIKGSARLEVTATGPDGKKLLNKMLPVNINGGTTYGQFISGGLKLAPLTGGYTTISAKLIQGSTVVTSGSDNVLVVSLQDGTEVGQIMVADTSGAMQGFLKSRKIAFRDYQSGRPDGKVMIVNAFDPQQTGNPLVTDILEWVNNGNTLIIAGNSEKWAEHLGRKEVISYRGAKELGTSWYGGNYFSRKHPIFEGLPTDCVFNWEYQCFATYNRKRIGLRVDNGEVLVACVSDHKTEVYSALSIVPHGRGRILLSSLDFASCINDIRIDKRAEGDGENASLSTFNASSKNSANVVGQRLLLNMVLYGSKIQ